MTSSGQVRESFLAIGFDLGLGTATVGFPKPKYKALFGQTHFRVHEHVRGACHGTVAALIAGVRNPDFSRRQFVRETKKSPIGTGIGAESFLPQK